jgi:hypothetical protein
VVLVAAAVEDRALDARVLRPLGEALAGLGRLLERLEVAQAVLRPLDGGQRVAEIVVDELREQPAVGAEHRDARALRGAADLRADAALALEAALLLGGNGHARFPTFLATYSPSYRIPLPL